MRLQQLIGGVIAAALIGCHSGSDGGPHGPPGAVDRPKGAVDGPTTGPSSMEKIDEAEKTGAIDHDTALLYHIYVLYDRARLPPEYLGDDDRISLEGTLLFSEIVDRFPAMSAAMQEKFDPFLRRPTDPRSRWAEQAAEAESAGSMVLTTSNGTTDGWASIDDAAGTYRIWYRNNRPEDGSLAQGILNDLVGHDAWGVEKRAMLGHEACSDDGWKTFGDGTPNDGGSPALDIYLNPYLLYLVPRRLPDYPTEDIVGVTLPLLKLGAAERTCAGRATVILLDSTKTRGKDTQPPDEPFLREAAAHEVFHSFQMGLAGYKPGPNDWFVEASANWAANEVFPTDNFEQAFLDPTIDPAPTWTTAHPGPLTSVKDTEAYAAYIWPFFLTHGKGKDADLIGGFWTSTDGTADKSVMRLMRDMPAWKDLFSEFLLWNVNEGALLRYSDPPGTLPLAPLQDPALPRQNIGSGGHVSIPVDVAPISGAYLEFDITGEPDVPKTLIFDLGELVGDDVTIQAIEKRVEMVDGKIVDKWTVENWTGETTKVLCNGDPGGLPLGVVLVVANTSIEPSATVSGTVYVHDDGAACAKGNATLSYHAKMHSDVNDPFTGATGMYEYAETIESTLQAVLVSHDDLIGYITYEVSGTHHITVTGGGSSSYAKMYTSGDDTDSLSGEGTVHTPAEPGDYWPWSPSDPGQKWLLTLHKDTGGYELSTIMPAILLNRSSTSHENVDCLSAGTSTKTTTWDQTQNGYVEKVHDCITGDSTSSPPPNTPPIFATWTTLGDDVCYGTVPAKGPIDVTASNTVPCDNPSGPNPEPIGGFSDYHQGYGPGCTVTYTVHFVFDPPDRW